MTKAIKVIITCIKVFFCMGFGAFLGGGIISLLNLSLDTFFLPASLLGTAILYILLDWFLHRRKSKNTVTEEFKYTKPETGKEKTAEPEKTEPIKSNHSDEYFDELRNRMTGSLIALYKETHEEKYNIEYLRRLTSIGFSEAEAENMFMFELMILKYDSREILRDPTYIYKNYFDLKTVPFPQEDSWYAEHQMFVMSEIVKIWDEAEYIWQTNRDQINDEAVRARIHSLSRYGGAGMFLTYMDMVSEKAHTPMPLLQAYVRGEQDLIWLYKWKKISAHPYAPK